MNEKTLARFWSKVDKNRPAAERAQELGACWVWIGPKAGRGYGTMSLGSRADHSDRTECAHRLSWEIANGPAGNSFVLHKCDNPPCVRPEHLFIGSQLDNMRDMRSKGRGTAGDTHPLRVDPSKAARGDLSGARLHPEARRRGAAHPQAKLTESDIPLIRHAQGSLAEIASRYGVCVERVFAIKKRRAWTHVPE